MNCPDCEGKDYIVKKTPHSYSRFEQVKCQRCDGRGEVFHPFLRLGEVLRK